MAQNSDYYVGIMLKAFTHILCSNLQLLIMLIIIPA